LPRHRSARDRRRPGRRIDGVGTVLVLGAVGLVRTALTEAARWPPSRIWPVLAAGLVLGAGFVAHIRRHPDPLAAPQLFSVRAFRAGAAGLVAYHTGFAAMLLATTLLLTTLWRFSVLQAAACIAPGPITAGILSPFSGRLSAAIGVRGTVVAGAVFFAAAGGWPLATAGDSSAYAAVVLPAMLAWGWPTRSSSLRCSPARTPRRQRTWRRGQRCWPRRANSVRPWGWRPSLPCSAVARRAIWPGWTAPG